MTIGGHHTKSLFHWSSSLQEQTAQGDPLAALIGNRALERDFGVHTLGGQAEADKQTGSRESSYMSDCGSKPAADPAVDQGRECPITRCPRLAQGSAEVGWR